MSLSHCTDSESSSGDIAKPITTDKTHQLKNSPVPPYFDIDWNPKDGRGRITQHYKNGDMLSICLQCKYEGYTGGLWIGSMNGSGMMWIPKKTYNGFKKLNIFCAQDESIFDETDKLELDSGWSENFGRGDDGLALEWQGGRILQGNPKKDLLLTGINSKGCYQVTRYLYWPLSTDYMLISSHIRNVCDRKLTFSFWSGEDPWIGTYKSSDGDVGWYNKGIIRSETAIPSKEFKFGGMYDLGNQKPGDKTTFSNVANFIMPDPHEPPASDIYFSNSFAHTISDIQPGKPLDNKSMTAINLGWRKIALAPQKEIRICYALGKAITEKPGQTPKVPDIPRDYWYFDSKWHSSSDIHVSGYKKGRVIVKSPLKFEAERIQLDLKPPQMTIKASYKIANNLSRKLNRRLFYPFPIDGKHPYPTKISISGCSFKKHEKGLLWNLAMYPREKRTIKVEYSQHCLDKSCTYILTSTQAWKQALEEAEYIVSWPKTLSEVKISLEGNITSDKDKKTLQTQRKNFLPKKDLTITWH